MSLLVVIVSSAFGYFALTHSSAVAHTACAPKAHSAPLATPTGACTLLTTSATTLPPPLALGTMATLTEGSPPQVASVQIKISRIWQVANPVPGIPGFNLNQELLLLHAPTNLDWIGVRMLLANVGQEQIEFASPTGPSSPYLGIVVNGKEPGFNGSAFPQLGFAMAVAGCPYPFPNLSVGAAPGSTTHGCIAIPVPAGLKVTKIGFDLTYAGMLSRHVARWQA